MKKTTLRKRLSVTVFAISMAMGMSACGTKGAAELTTQEILADMTEYTSESKTVSILLDEGWTTEDLGIDNWLGLQSKGGLEEVVVAQFPKNEYAGSINTLEDLQSMMDESFQVTNVTETDVPEVSALTNLSAVKCNINDGTSTGKACMVYGESDYAFYMLVYSAGIITDDKMASFYASCTSLKETPVEEENNFATEMTDTIRWFNASYAILTRVNNCNLNYFGGMAANENNAEINKMTLEEWWGVTDRATADESLNWLMDEGHRTDYKRNMQSFVEAGIQNVAPEERKSFILENYEVSDEDAEHFAQMYGCYEQKGENAIDAWDYCRALSLTGYYYLAGYYTEQEALDKALEIAQIMQPLYTSWDEAMDSYLLGYEYWSQESSEERRAIYDELKADENSVYNIDWNLAFEKTW